MATDWKSTCFHFWVFFSLYALTSFSQIQLVWGNLSVYVISYFHFRLNQEIGQESAWIASLFTVSWTLGLSFCERIAEKFQVRTITIASVVLFTGGIVTGYVAVQNSFPVLVLALGIMTGFGTGVAQAIQYKYICLWTEPRFVGFACCSIMSCQEIGSIVMNFVITWYINPKNLRPDTHSHHETLFSQPEILEKVPNVFLVYGGITLTIGMLSCVLITEKTNSGNPQPGRDTHSVNDINKNQTVNMSTIKCIEQTEQSDTIEDGIVSDKQEQETDSHNGIKPEVKQTEMSERTHLNAKKYDNNNRFENEENLEGVSIEDTTPRQAVKSRIFYLMLVLVFYVDVTYIVINTYYKLFGMIYNEDDHFFTNATIGFNIGAIITISIAGIACDRFGVKNTIIGGSSSMCVLSTVLSLSVQINKWFYLVCVIVYVGITNATYMTIPVCAIKYFGKTHGTTIFGITMLINTVNNLLVPVGVRFILGLFDWLTLFTTLAVVTLIGLLVIMVGLPAENVKKQ